MKTMLLVAVYRNGLMAFLAVFALSAMPARAQSVDQRWEPWLGCWTLATENLRSAEAQDNLPQRSSRPSTVRDGAPRVCVSRVPEGARFETTVGTQSAIDQTIAADAVSRPVNDAECSGTQRAEWSKSGLRLFSSAEIRCKGDDGLRRVSGLSLIAPNGDWLDIQTVAIGPRETIRVKRYYRAEDSPRSTWPTVASSRLTLDEVKDVSAKVSSAAVEAALVETNAGFDLSKKSVTDLASAGVSERVIDLLVALSYPEKFAIQAVGPGGGSVPTFVGFGSPYYYDPFYYGYGSPYLYEPFGYRGYIFVDGGVGGGGGGGVSIGQQPSVGRVINGQGYTRIVPRDPVASTNTQNGRTASTSSSYPSDAGSSSSGSSSSGSSSSSSSSGSSGGGGGGSTVSPSGASSGGSSDSGRTAVPR